MAVIDFVLGLLKVVTIVYDIGKIFFNFHDIFVFKNKMNYNFYYLFLKNKQNFHEILIKNNQPVQYYIVPDQLSSQTILINLLFFQ